MLICISFGFVIVVICIIAVINKRSKHSLSDNPIEPKRRATSSVMVPISHITGIEVKNNKSESDSDHKSNYFAYGKIELASDENIVSESEVPAYLKIGNLEYEKKYQEAIDYGLDLLQQTPMDCGAHVNLMVAYFKARKENPEYLGKSTYHARLAILYGHHTGYAEERLAKNLDRAKCYHQSIQLYDLILREDYHFTPHGCGNKEMFAKRREVVLQKMDKAKDLATDCLFSEEEIDLILQGIREDDERRLRAEEEWQRNMQLLEKTRYDDPRYKEILKSLHENTRRI